MVRLMMVVFIAFFFSLNTYAADCGVFKVVKGEVTYKKKSKNKFKKARKNKKVCQGDTVKTGDSGRTKIVMADSNEINISPKSEMTIETYEKGQKAVLNVINGKVRSDVKNKYKDTNQSHFRVKTKSAVAGVRGTEFLMSYDARLNQSRTVTFEGTVSVGKFEGGKYVPKVFVKPGQFTSNSPGVDPHDPKEVPPAELAAMDQESKIDSSDAGSGSKAPASAPADEPEDEKQDEPKNEPKDEPKKEREGAQGPDGEGPPPAEDGIAENGDGSDGTVGNGNPGDAPEGDIPLDSPDGDGFVDGSTDEYREDDQYGDPNFDPKEGDDGYAGDPTGDGSGDPMFNPDGTDGDRDLASIDGDGGDLGLPPPTLDDMPSGDDLALIEAPTVPIVNDPILDPSLINPCGTTCTDPLLNQNVRVIINLIPPGSAN